MCRGREKQIQFSGLGSEWRDQTQSGKLGVDGYPSPFWANGYQRCTLTFWIGDPRWQFSSIATYRLVIVHQIFQHLSSNLVPCKLYHQLSLPLPFGRKAVTGKSEVLA